MHYWVTADTLEFSCGLLFASLGFVNGMRISYIFVSLTYFIAGIIRYRLTETIENAEKVKIKELLKAFPLSYIKSVKMIIKAPKSLRYLIIGNNIFTLAYAFVSSYIIVYATTDLGLSKIQWSIVLTIEAILSMILIVPFGKLADRYGGKKAVIAFNLVSAVCVTLVIFGSYYLLLIIVPISGIAISASYAAFQKLTADMTQRNIRGKTIGLIRFFSLIVSALGSLLGGIIYQNTPHSSVFILSVVTVLFGVVFFIYFVKEPEIGEQ